MYKGVRVLDIHGHLSTPPIFFSHAYNLQIGGPVAASPVPEDALEAMQQQHLKQLDERNIDYQLISPRPFAMMHWERPHIVERWTEATNRIIHTACSLHSDRLGGVAQLPQHSTLDTSNCIAELDRCINEYGFSSALINPDPSGARQTPGMDSEYWFPLYERAQALNVTLVVHGSAVRDMRTMNNQWNFMAEQTLATILLENSTVFDRFPDLRILVVHCGGAPSRLLTDPPKSMVGKNLFFDTCAYDVDYLQLAIKQRGLHSMCFGTETPGSGTGTINPDTGKPSDDMVPVIDSIPTLTDADKQFIFQDNPRKVFPLMRA